MIFTTFLGHLTHTQPCMGYSRSQTHALSTETLFLRPSNLLVHQKFSQTLSELLEAFQVDILIQWPRMFSWWDQGHLSYKRQDSLHRGALPYQQPISSTDACPSQSQQGYTLSQGNSLPLLRRDRYCPALMLSSGSPGFNTNCDSKDSTAICSVFLSTCCFMEPQNFKLALGVRHCNCYHFTVLGRGS